MTKRNIKMMMMMFFLFILMFFDVGLKLKVQAGRQSSWKQVSLGKEKEREREVWPNCI
jgi:hypothetical protein